MANATVLLIHLLRVRKHKIMVILVHAGKLHHVFLFGGVGFHELLQRVPILVREIELLGIKIQHSVGRELDRRVGDNRAVVVHHDIPGQLAGIAPILIGVAHLIKVITIGDRLVFDAVIGKNGRLAKYLGSLIGRSFCEFSHRASPRSIIWTSTVGTVPSF